MPLTLPELTEKVTVWSLATFGSSPPSAPEPPLPPVPLLSYVCSVTGVPTPVTPLAGGVFDVTDSVGIYDNGIGSIDGYGEGEEAVDSCGGCHHGSD